MRAINEIIIHCTATGPNWWASKPTKSKVNEVRRWHVEDRGWSDIGYHYLIDRNGTIAEGRPVERSGAHTKGHNANSIGISLFGGHGGAATDAFDDNFTLEQEVALRELIEKLQGEHPNITKISGHNQYSSKACPCFSVPNWLSGGGRIAEKPLVESQERTSRKQSKTVQATVVQGASAVGGAVGALNALDGTAQIIALVGCFVIGALAMFILKERLRKWALGDR
jgi:N-acetylmuramoyl-L-alanine amidase